MGPIKLNSTSLAFLRESLPYMIIVQRRVTASVICSSISSWSISAIYEPLHAWEGGGWSPPPSPRVTLTSIKSYIWSLHVGWSCQCPGVRDCSEGNWLHCVNLKGFLEKVHICDILSSDESISSLRLWTALPVLLASPLWDEGVKEMIFLAPAPPWVTFLHFPMVVQKS